MRFTQFLQNSAEDINQEIESYFTEWSKDIEQISPRLLPLVTALGDASKDGKRIRGTLVLLGSQIASDATFMEKNKSALLKVAIAYEIFQTAILAHDDIIDKSPTRRGKPSLYMQLGGNHFGKSQAICLGDIGFFLAFRIIAESNFQEKEKNKALTFFSQAVHDTVIGEVLDVDISESQYVVSEKDVLDVARLKTAYYTFVGPLMLGAVLGGADTMTLGAIKTYGENIGIAFQIQDDINDTFGSQAVLKKEVGGDIKEGKNTLLVLKAREKANKEQEAILQTSYGKAVIGREEIEVVKNVFIETGALEYAKSLAHSYSMKADSAIPQITKDEQMQGLLREIITYVNGKKEERSNRYEK
jgi:geranylgeranyl pyrophosphate synthase